MIRADERKCDEKNCNERENFSHQNLRIALKSIYFAVNILNYIIKDGIFLRENLRMKFMNFKKMTFLRENRQSHFPQAQHRKINFEFNIIFDTQKLKFRKKRKGFENKENYSFNEQIENSLIILKLEPNFSEDQLKARYKKLVKKYHPDVKII